MKRLLVFIVALFAIGAVHGECNVDYYFDGENCVMCPAGTYNDNPSGTECTPCPVGTYSRGPAMIDGVDGCSPCDAGTYADTPGSGYCTVCPDDMFSMAGATQCGTAAEVCAPGTYGNSSTRKCVACPEPFPNSDPGAIGINSCYTDTLTRDCSEMCVSDGCYDVKCNATSCDYAVFRGKGLNHPIKWGCASCDDVDIYPVSVSAMPGHRVVGASCEICPAGTYSAGGGATTCDPCPDGATTFIGASSRDECMRILNYLQPGKTNPTQILLKMVKQTSPALAVQIAGDVFYGNMTPVNTADKSGLYVEYNNQQYMVQDNNATATDSAFYIITTPDTTLFNVNILAYGEFTINWGDGTVEDIVADAPPYYLSHDYTTPHSYKIGINGRATGYYAAGKGLNKKYITLSFSSKSSIARIAGSLGAIFPTLDDGTNPNFTGLFSGARNLTGQIPHGLFSGITGSPSMTQFASTSGMFQSVFDGCSGLSGQISTGLFGNLSGNPGAMTFVNAFNGCTGLTGPAAQNPDGTPLYDIEYNGQTWYEQAPNVFTDMYTDSGIDTGN